MKKVKPITIDKRCDPAEAASEKGCVSTPSSSWITTVACCAVESAFAGNTSLLSGCISKASTQTMMDCHRLLKFAKENSDVGLVYDPLGASAGVEIAVLLRCRLCHQE